MDNTHDEKWNWFVAAETGKVRVLRSLLRRHPSLLDAADENGWTALHRAAQFGHDSTVRLLISVGANVNAIDYRRSSPLHAASGSVEASHQVLCMLLNAGANINHRDTLWYSPLMEAAQTANIGAVGCLLALGANTSYRNRFGMNAMEIVKWQLSQTSLATDAGQIERMKLVIAMLSHREPR